jgi:hypothetical protein
VHIRPCVAIPHLGYRNPAHGLLLCVCVCVCWWVGVGVGEGGGLVGLEVDGLAAHSSWSGPRPGGLALRLRDSWGTEVRGWSSLALAAWADIFLSN